MKMKFAVKAVTTVTTGKLLVQLAGEYGNIQLNLPDSQQIGLRVGQEFILATEGLSFIGAIDETRSKSITESQLPADLRGGLAGLAGSLPEILGGKAPK
jgi:hypothetical protein